MSSADKMFSEWYSHEIAAILKVKKGKRPNEIQTTAEWARLDIPTRTVLLLFFNAHDGASDKIAYLDSELVRYIQGHIAEDILKNPDASRCLQLFLGEEE
jgi:hypothetical protein